MTSESVVVCSERCRSYPIWEWQWAAVTGSGNEGEGASDRGRWWLMLMCQSRSSPTNMG